MTGLRDRATLGVFDWAWDRLPGMPQAKAAAMFRWLGDLAWLRHGGGVRQLEANLARVTGLSPSDPALRVLSRDALRRYAAYWCDLFRMPGWSEQTFNERIVLHGLHNLEDALAEGRGTILAASHSANWDHAGAWLARRFGGVTTVAERLRPEGLFEAFVARRAPYGIEILPHRGGDRPSLTVLAERLQAGRFTALIADRDLSRRGVEVQFFGHTARMAAGPAVLACRTGAALIVAGMWMEGETLHVRLHPPLAVPQQGAEDDRVRTTTQRIADVFEAEIAAHPADWHMLQRVWSDL